MILFICLIWIFFICLLSHGYFLSAWYHMDIFYLHDITWIFFIFLLSHGYFLSACYDICLLWHGYFWNLLVMTWIFSSACYFMCLISHRCPSDYLGDNCEVTYDLCALANPCVGPGSNCAVTNGTLQCHCSQGNSYKFSQQINFGILHIGYIWYIFSDDTLYNGRVYWVRLSAAPEFLWEHHMS
jgi:hypothetical protein